ncbi:MAG TPA: patatin-like phospholipase family protein [Acidimicrobiales bacterium]|nr:patatin-like phospholipase family protein [Acidimicrobiales bacterium]
MSYKIVSFCGGGFRGLMSAEILNQLWTACPNILTGTDLFAGTSTGADITSFLLAGLTPPEIISFFLEREVPFFQSPTGSGSREPRYDIKAVHGGQVALHGPLKTLNDFDQSMLLTAFNVQNSHHLGWTPLLYNNLSKSTNGDTKIADAVTSSGSMPGMVGSWKGNVDGAFVHHDPTIPAIALAMNEGIPIEEIVVICIGTGFMPTYLTSDTSVWGAEQWQNGVPGNPDHITPLLVGGTVSPILSITLNGTSSSLMPTLAGMMLPGRYVNINPVLKTFISEIDTTPEALATLISLGQADSPQIELAKQLLRTYWT